MINEVGGLPGDARTLTRTAKGKNDFRDPDPRMTDLPMRCSHDHALLVIEDGVLAWKGFSPSDIATLRASRTDLEVAPGGSFISPRFSPTRPFRESIASWNLDVGEGGGAILELAVGSGPDPTRSHWMRIGVVGALPASVASEGVPASTPDGGRIDVDIFRGDSDVTFAELRIRAFIQPVVVRSLVLIATRREEPATNGDAGSQDAAVAATERRLPVPFRSQQVEAASLRARICSPTSVSMVMQYRGVHLTTAEVAGRVFDRDHDLYGNWPRNVQAAHEAGLRGYVARISSWAQVEALIAADVPLVISIAVKEGQLGGAPYTSTAGHLLVLTGFSKDGDVHVNDPAAHDASAGVTTYRRAELEVVWIQRGGTAYIFP